tara:strand:+ start:589 stop:939 length:351 start_codon:yes stop_codon:yes gene_type:complete
MTPDQRVRYEDMYRSLWIKQNILDKKANPLAKGPSVHFKVGLQGGNYGARGGRSAGPVEPNKPKVYKMSNQARIANRLIKQGLSMKHIADIFGVNIQHISNLKSRFDLPRDEEETT